MPIVQFGEQRLDPRTQVGTLEGVVQGGAKQAEHVACVMSNTVDDLADHRSAVREHGNRIRQLDLAACSGSCLSWTRTSPPCSSKFKARFGPKRAESLLRVTTMVQ